MTLGDGGDGQGLLLTVLGAFSFGWVRETVVLCFGVISPSLFFAVVLLRCLCGVGESLYYSCVGIRPIKASIYIMIFLVVVIPGWGRLLFVRHQEIVCIDYGTK